MQVMLLKDSSLITQAQAIRDAVAIAMEHDPRIFLTGEGVTDPRGVFGTTLDLVDRFGRERVFDSPFSDNGMAGICLGAALTGMKPILVFSRIEFALLAFDQLVNNTARWQTIFGPEQPIPFVIRVIFGRGYGIDPNHSLDMQALLAQIPGITTVMPTTAYDAKGLLLAAIENPNPVLFLEHRYLHDTIDYVPDEAYIVQLTKSEVVAEGTALTIAAYSYSVLAASKAAESFREHGVEIEVINLRSTNPIDFESLEGSVKKTGRLLIADTATHIHGIAAAIIPKVLEQGFYYLTKAPLIVNASDDINHSFFNTQVTTEAINIAKGAFTLLDDEIRKQLSLNKIIDGISNYKDAQQA